MITRAPAQDYGRELAGELDRLAAELEQARVAAEDARAEADQLSEENAALRQHCTALEQRAEAGRQSRRAAEVVLTAELARLRVQLQARESEAAIRVSTEEELRATLEELHALAEEVERSRSELMRLNAELDIRIAARTAELKETGERLQLALRFAQAAVWEWDLDSGHFVWTDEYRALVGLLPGPPPADWLETVAPEDRDEVRAALAHCLEACELDFTVTYRLATPSHGARWLAKRGRLVCGPDGLPLRLIGLAVDITAAKQAEQQQSLLIGALQRRVGEALATFRSIAFHTLAHSTSLDVCHAALEGRLDALARAQALLSRHTVDEASLEELVVNELTAHGGRLGENVTVQGPEVRLRPKLVRVLAMIFHELSANAVGHGALAVPGGQVRVSWSARQGAAGHELALRWQESGVPLMDLRPARQGYGRALIASPLLKNLGAQARLEFRPGGACCALVLPLAPALATVAEPARVTPHT